VRRLDLFDTTLRDGEQSLETTLDSSRKLEIARQLVRLGVDVIEAGFPVSSPGELESVKRISQEIKGPVICGLARCVEKDIDYCAEALKKAESSRINLGLAVSSIHMEKKLRLKPEQVVEKAVLAVKYAGKTFGDVQFFAEDALRSDFNFLVQILEKVIKAGAGVVTISDTVGIAMPWKIGEIITRIRGTVRDIDKVKLSIHCHNDLGLALANSLSAVMAGVDQVEGTINGIGERAGNASLEEVIMALYMHPESARINMNVNIKEIYETCKTVSRITEVPVPVHKAIVGDNMFRHASGIHQDGMIKENSTYELFRPEIIGAPACRIVLNSKSGRNALKHKLEEMGYTFHQSEIERIYREFVHLADARKRYINEEELIGLLPV